MKVLKKLWLLIILLLICILLIFVTQIYAKYLSSAAGDTNMAIAKWNILVNNHSIKNNTDISSTIVPVFPGNDYISSGIIAPTAEGYFDLDFNFSDVDVAFRYEISVSAAENSSVKDLVATGYSIDDSPKIEFDTFNEPITDVIPLNVEKKDRKLRIYILWNDDEETSEMSNDDDTISTSAENPALLNVNISFTQITEEQLENTQNLN